jgi:formamidopyrimidine-DNA glycosylase
MPELPEVETVRRDLETLCTRTITRVEYGRLRTLRRYADPVEFVHQLDSARIDRIDRHGKYLLVRLDPAPTASDTLVIHLRMSGQLLLHERGDDPVVAHTHVRLGFDDGRELRFVDPRTFGEMFVTARETPELARLGPDAWLALDDAALLRRRAGNRRAAVKAVLLDQSVVAGIGSIYADEICHRAGIRPSRPMDRVRPGEYPKLFAAVREVLGEAIAARGSTLGDGQYVGLDGESGSFAASHRVHARADRPCPACGTAIRTGTVAQRSAYWCPTCQR